MPISMPCRRNFKCTFRGHAEDMLWKCPFFDGHANGHVEGTLWECRGHVDNMPTENHINTQNEIKDHINAQNEIENHINTHNEVCVSTWKA